MLISTMVIYGLGMGLLPGEFGGEGGIEAGLVEPGAVNAIVFVGQVFESEIELEVVGSYPARV